MRLLLALIAAQAAVALGVMFVIAMRSRDTALSTTLGVALFSVLLVMMVALREAL
jgi:hypothetical protein